MSVKWLLSLYPRAWRQRYQEEMLGLLELHHVTWRTRADLIRGAFDAHVSRCFPHPIPLFSPEKARRLRHAHSTILWAFPLLVLGYLFFLDDLDDAFYVWNRAHAALWNLKILAEALTAIGFVSFLLTGMVLGVALLKQTLRQRAQSKRIVQSGLLLVLTVCCLHLYAPQSSLCPLALLAAVTPFALAAVLSHRELSPRLLNYALVPMTLTALGMVAQVLFVAIWSGSIWRVSTPAVQRMAQAADRHPWAGDWWHLQAIGGLIWMGLLTSYTLRHWGRALFTSSVEETFNGTSNA